MVVHIHRYAILMQYNLIKTIVGFNSCIVVYASLVIVSYSTSSDQAKRVEFDSSSHDWGSTMHPTNQLTISIV